MKETLNTTTTESTAFTLAMSADAKIKVSSDFVGAVWLEYLIPDESVWGVEPGTVSDKDNSFEVVSNDATVQYRFAAKIQAGSAVCYIDGTEVV